MSVTSSVGLISGIDHDDIINQLISIEQRPVKQIQGRNSVLQAQQTAYQEISAKLLSVKNAANNFSSDSAFEATTAASSNESVLTATAGDGAIPGNYTFRVAQLVSAQQSISGGFADTQSTTFGPSTLTFERGEARLDSHTNLSTINGGEGLSRGQIRITDRTGASTLVDLSSAVTVDDVVDQINNATGVSVIAAIQGDHLTLADASGGLAADLKVADVGTTATATSLGLAQTDTTGAGAITGGQINRIGEQTRLASLNDGNGVRGNGDANDFAITTGSGTFNIDADAAATLGDLFDQIDEKSNGTVTATATEDGVGIRLIDESGGTVSVAALGGSRALGDLGLDNATVSGNELSGGRVIASINSKLLKNLAGGQGLGAFGGAAPLPLSLDTDLADIFGDSGVTTTGDGTADLNIKARGNANPYHINIDGADTIGELADAISNQTAGGITLSIQDNQLRLNDNTGGTGSLEIQDAGGSNVASTLGIAGSYDADSIVVPNAQPQTPAAGGATLRVTDSAGASAQIDLSGAQSVSDVLDTINDAGLGVRASLNRAGNGIALTDTANGVDDLTIADVDGTLARQLGIEGAFHDRAEGSNLQLQYVTEASTLQGLGIQRGKFEIRDSGGQTATVDLTQGNETTLADVISEINSRGLDVTARINDTGDGLLLEDNGPGTVELKVTDSGSTTAADLGIVGTASAPGEDIDGSYEKTVQVAQGDTLQKIVNKINDADVGISAGIVNDGSPDAPYRLSLSADKAGSAGSFVFDDGALDLGVQTLAEAQDAVAFYGSSDPSKAILITSKTNSLKNVIPGLTVDLKSTSDQAVQVSVSEDTEAVTSAVQNFVKSFNTAIDAIDKYDSYNEDTEERGLLLGDSAVSQVRRQLFDAVTNANSALTGQYKALSQVGLRIQDGALALDQSKFNAALAQDPDAVKNLFSYEQFATDEDGEKTDTLIAQGVGVEINKLLESLTDSSNGLIQRSVDRLQGTIDLNKDRIETLNDRIADKKARLQDQFNGLETALAKLQGQQSSLNSLAQVASNAGKNITGIGGING